MNNDFLKLNEILSSYSKGNKNRAYTKLKKISVKLLMRDWFLAKVLNVKNSNFRVRLC